MKINQKYLTTIPVLLIFISIAVWQHLDAVIIEKFSVVPLPQENKVGLQIQSHVNYTGWLPIIIDQLQVEILVNNKAFAQGKIIEKFTLQKENELRLPIFLVEKMENQPFSFSSSAKEIELVANVKVDSHILFIPYSFNRHVELQLKVSQKIDLDATYPLTSTVVLSLPDPFPTHISIQGFNYKVERIKRGSGKKQLLYDSQKEQHTLNFTLSDDPANLLPIELQFYVNKKLYRFLMNFFSPPLLEISGHFQIHYGNETQTMPIEFSLPPIDMRKITANKQKALHEAFSN